VPGANPERPGDGTEGLGAGDEQQVQPLGIPVRPGKIVEELPAPCPPLPGARVDGDVLELVDRREENESITVRPLAEVLGHRQAC
jgi:hypothetical protein